MGMVFDDRGSGETVVLLHGTPSPPDHFAPLVERLAARYRVLVPVQEVEDVFVLPRTAITEDGPDRVILVPTGDGGFEPVPVAVLFEDEERVVLAADANPALRPGMRVVTRGAFELGLAMHADEGSADHGHSH